MAQRKLVTTQTSSVVKFPARVPNLLATVDRLHIVEREVILSLENQSDQELLDTRKRAKLAGRFAWRIEVAVDAQTVLRAEKKTGKSRPGLDRSDENHPINSGRVAAVKRRAREIGVTPNTVFQNARIFRLIQEVEGKTNNDLNSSLHSLDEKGFYIAALSAINPSEALILFAEKKVTLNRFRVTDAFRLLEKEGLTKKQRSLRTVQSVKESVPDLSQSRKEEVQHIVDSIQLVQSQIILLSTNEEVTRIHESYVQELGEYLQYEMLGFEVASNLTIEEVIKAWTESNK